MKLVQRKEIARAIAVAAEPAIESAEDQARGGRAPRGAVLLALASYVDARTRGMSSKDAEAGVVNLLRRVS